MRWIVAYAAVHKAGAVVVPTNTRLTIPEVATILGHAEVSAIITCGALLDPGPRGPRRGPVDPASS